MNAAYANYELLFDNNVSTTLGSNLASGATSMTVATGAGVDFPDPGTGQAFLATLVPAGSTTGTPNEVVLVTARSGDTMTIVRGQDGTTARSFNAGDTVAMYPTAGTAASFAQALDLQAQSGNAAADSGAANAGAITLAPVPVSLASLAGSSIRVRKTSAANSGPYTLNVNLLGATPVLLNGAALTGGELAASTTFELIYNSAGHFDLVSPPAVLQPSSVANSMLALMAGLTIKANAGSGSANPQDLSILNFFNMVGLTLQVAAYDVYGPITFNVPADALPWALSFVTGAGGGAAGSQSSQAGGAGGAGGTAIGVMSMTPGGTLTGTVGLHGDGGTPGTNGTSGASSTLTNGSTTFTGGGGYFGYGVTGNSAGGSGGSATGGQLNILGGYGSDGAATSVVAPWAAGGASFWGGGARAAQGTPVIAAAWGSGGAPLYGSAGDGGGAADGAILILYFTHN